MKSTMYHVAPGAAKALYGAVLYCNSELKMAELWE